MARAFTEWLLLSAVVIILCVIGSNLFLTASIKEEAVYENIRAARCERMTERERNHMIDYCGGAK